MKQIKTHASENVIKVLIGNKSDCTDREISFEEGKKLAETYGIEFFETSAKEDRNIKEAFYYLAREIKDKVLVENRPSVQPIGGTRLTPGTDKPVTKSSCC